jgi:hypothetical protein
MGNTSGPGVAPDLSKSRMSKRRGRHPKEALTGNFIYSVSDPGFYADGNGLYLRVDSAGCRRWILRTVVQGKRRDIGLGSFTRVSLIEARARARALQRTARAGLDPLAVREQVCGTRYPEVTQATNDTLELLRKAVIVIDEAILTKLGVTE